MSFPLAGNARIRGALTAAIESGRLPHAILIEGDKGTGRHTLAAFTARAAVCEGENKPCGECRGCRLEHAGTHPDIWTVAPEDGKKNITVAQIRSLRSEAYVKPHMSARRVFIIDMADTMNEQAQNALLKVLEEPPGSVLFILIAENKAALLDTVISRCTVLSLSPPEISEAEKYMVANTNYTAEQISPALKETGGNIGAALNLLSGSSSDAVKAAEEFIRLMLSSDELGMLKTSAKFEKNRTEADAFLKELKLCTAAALKKNLTNSLTARTLSDFYAALGGFEQSLSTNVNLSLLFSALVCKATEIS